MEQELRERDVGGKQATQCGGPFQDPVCLLSDRGAGKGEMQVWAEV